MTTNTFKQELFASETGDGIVALIEIDHANLANPYFFVNDVKDIVSRGQTYQAHPFRIRLPNESEDEIPKAEIQIDNVDRLIVDTIRSVQGDVSLKLELILFSDPDTVEVGPYNFRLQSVSYNASRITGRLSYENNLDERFPRYSYDPPTTPALFRE